MMRRGSLSPRPPRRLGHARPRQDERRLEALRGAPPYPGARRSVDDHLDVMLDFCRAPARQQSVDWPRSSALSRASFSRDFLAVFAFPPERPRQQIEARPAWQSQHSGRPSGSRLAFDRQALAGDKDADPRPEQAMCSWIRSLCDVGAGIFRSRLLLDSQSPARGVDLIDVRFLHISKIGAIAEATRHSGLTLHRWCRRRARIFRSPRGP